MAGGQKADKIRLFCFSTPPMRAFHMTWLAFLLCFFAWFGIAPLMIVIRKEMNLSESQVFTCMIASVAATILARLVVGRLCDKYGPRRVYSALLILGSIPVMGAGLAQSYEGLLVVRLLIGFIGASFVVTQYHTSLMFAPNCVGLANAMTAGLGNAGGGLANAAMPLLLAFFVGVLGVGDYWGWRLSMVIVGVLALITGLLYPRMTQDTPDGNYETLRKSDPLQGTSGKGTFLTACADSRVWILFVLYGACFGVELTIHNMAAIYFTDKFDIGLKAAGMAAGLFGLLAVFARSLGGWLSDRLSLRIGLRGRVMLLGSALMAEGLALIFFARSGQLGPAIVLLAVFGVFVHMSCGATYAVVPFINRKALGSVAGIVGAGGNVGALASLFLLKGSDSLSSGLLTLGCVVSVSALLVLLVRLPSENPAPITEDAAPPASAAEPEPVYVKAG